MSTLDTMTDEPTGCEVTTCSGSSTEQAEPHERAVPGGKRSPWDHCLLTDLGGFPHFDFHEENRNCSGDT